MLYLYLFVIIFDNELLLLGVCMDAFFEHLVILSDV